MRIKHRCPNVADEPVKFADRLPEEPGRRAVDRTGCVLDEEACAEDTAGVNLFAVIGA